MDIEIFAVRFMESFFIVAAGFSIFGIKLEIKKICKIAIIQVIVIYAVRRLYVLLNFPLGTHTIIIGIVGILVSKVVTNNKSIYCALGYFIGIALVLMGEGVLVFPLCIKLHIDPLSYLHDPLAFFLINVLNESFLIIAFIMCYLFDFKLIDLKKINRLDKKV